MNYETLNLQRTGHVATLTLSRPEKLNAFNQQLTREFHQALDELDGEFPEIRVLILTGAGRGFCSGADVDTQAEGLTKSQGKRSDQRDADGGFKTASLPLGLTCHDYHSRSSQR